MTFPFFEKEQKLTRLSHDKIFRVYWAGKDNIFYLPETYFKLIFCIDFLTEYR